MEEFERIPKPRLSDRESAQPNMQLPASPVADVRPSIRVCIIGAGLAGLSAAEALTLRGKEESYAVEVTVLEAMKRPGGRAYTLTFGSGLVEGGAQYIHGCEGNPVYHRARQQKLKLNDCHRPGCTFNINHRSGKQVPNSLYSEVGALYDAIIAKTQGGKYKEELKGCGDKTVGAFVKRHFEKYLLSSGSLQELETKANVFRLQVLQECCYSACNRLEDLMLQDFGEYNQIFGNVTFAGGYNQLVETFVKNIPRESLVYNKPVQQVAWNCCKGDLSKGKPIIITCEDGDEYKADYVIVTTSLGYLKENAATMFSPSLPTPKLDLISRMGFGTAGKIFLEYETPFWAENWGGVFLVGDSKPSDFMVDEFKEEEWYKHFYSIQSIENNPRLLKVWMYGRSAEFIETLDDDVIGKTITDKILREYLDNPTIPIPDRVYKTQWHSNPYVRGSYSYVATGSCGADIDALAEPLCTTGENGLDQPTLCFAGEATHRTFYSTTHGAMLSGQREAERILKDVKLRATPKPMPSKDALRITKVCSTEADKMMGKLTL